MTELSKDHKAAIYAVVVDEFLKPRSKGVSFKDRFAYRGRNAVQVVDQLQLPIAYIAMKQIGDGRLPDWEVCKKIMRYTQTVLATLALREKSEVAPRTNLFYESPIKLEGVHFPFRSRNFHSPVPQMAIDAAQIFCNSALSIWPKTFEALLQYRETLSDNVVSAVQTQSPREMWWSTRSVEQFKLMSQLDATYPDFSGFDLNPRNHAGDHGETTVQGGKNQKALTRQAEPEPISDEGTANLIGWGHREFSYKGTESDYEKHLQGILKDPLSALKSGINPIELSLAEGVEEARTTKHTRFLAGFDVGGHFAIAHALRAGIKGERLERIANARHPEYVDPKSAIARAIRQRDPHRLFEGVPGSVIRSEIAGEVGSPVAYGGTEDAVTSSALGLDMDENRNFILENKNGNIDPVPPACIAHRFEGMKPEAMIKEMRNFAKHWVSAVHGQFPFLEPNAKASRIAWAEALNGTGLPLVAESLGGFSHEFLPFRYDKPATMGISAKWFADDATGTTRQTKAQLREELGLEWSEFNEKFDKGDILEIQNSVMSFKPVPNKRGGNVIAQFGQSEDAYDLFYTVNDTVDEGINAIQHTHDDIRVTVNKGPAIQRAYVRALNSKGGDLPADAIVLRCFYAPAD